MELTDLGRTPLKNHFSNFPLLILSHLPKQTLDWRDHLQRQINAVLAMNSGMKHLLEQDRIRDSSGRVRVGRDSNTSYITFRYEFAMHGQRTDRQTDGVSNRVACTRLKTKHKPNFRPRRKGTSVRTAKSG